MSIRFKNPPINELVIGAYFNPSLRTLKSEHIGLLWSRFRDDFPIVKQREPLSIGVLNPTVSVGVSDEFLFMPRYWFISEDGASLIQVQKNAFLLNWRKQDTEYPDYTDHLKPCFDRNFAKFRNFLQEDVGATDLRIGLCELTYVDLITPCEYWQGPQDTQKLISSFEIPNFGVAGSNTTEFHCQYQYEIAPNLQLGISLRTTRQNEPSNVPNLIIESKATGLFEGATHADTDGWYETAHNVLVDRFLQMTDPQIQTMYWQPEDKSQ